MTWLKQNWFKVAITALVALAIFLQRFYYIKTEISLDTL